MSAFSDTERAQLTALADAGDTADAGTRATWRGRLAVRRGLDDADRALAERAGVALPSLHAQLGVTPPPVIPEATGVAAGSS